MAGLIGLYIINFGIQKIQITCLMQFVINFFSVGLFAGGVLWSFQCLFITSINTSKTYLGLLFTLMVGQTKQNFNQG